MGKREAAFAGRAWRLLRLTFLWARKGGIFKRGKMPDLRLLPDYIKGFRAARADMIHYGEREFSLDETPIFHFKASRAKSSGMLRIPCLRPSVDIDDDYEFLFRGDTRASYIRGGGGAGAFGEDGVAERDLVNGGGAAEETVNGLGICCSTQGEEVDNEEGKRDVDEEADEFIAKFYAQIRLHRQISLLQYNEMLARSTS